MSSKLSSKYLSEKDIEDFVDRLDSTCGYLVKEGELKWFVDKIVDRETKKLRRENRFMKGFIIGVLLAVLTLALSGCSSRDAQGGVCNALADEYYIQPCPFKKHYFFLQHKETGNLYFTICRGVNLPKHYKKEQFFLYPLFINLSKRAVENSAPERDDNG